MPLFQNHVGINLTSSKIQLVEIISKQDGFYLENVGEEIFDESFKEELKETKLVSVLQNSFNKVLSRIKLNSRNLSFTLSSEFFKICELPYEGSLIKKDLLNHLKWEISILFPSLNFDNIFVQHIEVDKSNIRKQKKIGNSIVKRALVFGLNKKLITVLQRFSFENGFELKFVDNSHIASNAIIVIEGLSSAGEIVGSLLLDGCNCSLAIMEGNYPVYFKSSNSLNTHCIDFLKRELTAVNESDKLTGTIKKLFLFGEGVTDEFVEDLRSEFSFSIIRSNPFTKLRVNKTIAANDLYRKKNYSFSAAAGIALRIV